MKKVRLTEAKDNAKYILYADTMKCGNSDFMADMEESIDKQDLKKALKWIPEEAIIENGKVKNLETNKDLQFCLKILFVHILPKLLQLMHRTILPFFSKAMEVYGPYVMVNLLFLFSA